MSSKIPEIPSDAPFSPEQRAWLQQYLQELVASIGAQSAGGATQIGCSKGRVLILFGSQSGNAQGLADGFAERLRGGGYAAAAVDMQEHESVDLTKEAAVLVVTSTWGEGDPPDNALDFCTKIGGKAFPRLENTSFSVLSLGDTSYADFCETGKRLDARFEELGAKRFVDRVDCDVDFEEKAEAWFTSVVAGLDAMALPDAGGVPIAGQVVESVAGGATQEPYSKKNPFPAPLLVNRQLNLNNVDGRDTRHLELSLKDSGLTYDVGDVVGVLPQNDPDLVDELLELMPFNTTVSVKAHNGEKMPVRDALIQCYDVRTINKTLLKKWRERAGSPYLKSVIDADSKEHIDEIIDGREIIDLVMEYPAEFKNAQDFIDILRKLTPRLYSIASSVNAHPDEVHLTVARVEYETHGRHRKGVASNYLCSHPCSNGGVKVFIQPAKHFKLPESGDTPIVMVGPGTGIAPFRAFLEERQIAGAKGENWLFFGNPYEETDFFYADEFSNMLKSGLLTRLDLAWSRDQEQKVYVQDKLRENSEELWRWINRGAHFYVCGDASRMAVDVDKALHDTVERFGKMSETEAADYVAKMKKEKRYQRDVY